MEPMRTEHDPLHKASSHKLDKASSVKRECAATRKALRKYLNGHLFKLQKMKVERHLKTCVVCSSEYQALKKEHETRRILKDITPPEGVVQHLKEGAFALAGLKKLFYRPLLLAAIVGVVALVLVTIHLASRRGDPEIENLEKSLPPAAAPMAVASAPAATPAAPPAKPAPVQAASPQSAHRPVQEVPVGEPLVITITPRNEKAAVRRINEVMRGHGSLWKLHFSDTVREISGNLPAKELLAFLDRIESAGTVSYSRKRFETFPTAQPIPFVMKLMPAPRIAERPATPIAPKGYKPAETTQPASAPTHTALP
jgi:hypothetical protein